MRLATITNWAYGATVALTLASGATMLLASRAYDEERAAVERRFALDKATSSLTEELFLASDHARQFLNSADPTYRILYDRDLAGVKAWDDRILHLVKAGTSGEELALIRGAMSWAGSLRDEQAAALYAHHTGDEALARKILFGAEYERDLDRARTLAERFTDRVDQRTEAEVAQGARLSRWWKRVSEAVLATTALLFVGVLSFVFKRRVLRPVLRLSDVISRLAAQDFAVEPPAYDQIDEIGDMAQAIRVFRENGIERQRLEEERKADVAMRDLLARMTQRMQGCDSLSDLKAVIGRFVPQIAPRLPGRLYLLDENRNAVVAACSWLDPRGGEEEFTPLACWALRRGLPHRLGGEDVDVPCQHLQAAESLAGTLCLPLTAQRETLGLLYFEPSADDGEAGSIPDVYLRMLAENVGLALANLRLRDALHEMAMADPLTGLANRRSLDDVLDKSLASAALTGQPLSCLMLDVDHFKTFNDRFGHDAGDEVLRQVGALLRTATRDDGLSFRFGGEEFLVLLPGLGPEEARARAEQIREGIQSLRVTHAGCELGEVSASIGVATMPVHCGSGQLTAAADAALLRAKAEGRNRVQLAQKESDRRAA